MTDKTDAAFPHGTVLAEREQDIVECAATGLSAAELVAIKTMVPCCDTPWINKAIIEGWRLDYAGQALAFLGNEEARKAIIFEAGGDDIMETASLGAARFADAMIAELTKDR